MLVLSRRPDERIVFPHLGITVRVLRIQGNAVRIGVEAPPDVRVLRHELADEPGGHGPPARSLAHELCNRLNKVNLALHLTQRQLETGNTALAEASLADALKRLEELDHQWV